MSALPRKSRVRGLSLIEIMIGIAVLAIISVAVMGLFHVGIHSFNRTARKDQLQENARKTLDLIAGELRTADPTGITTTPVASTLNPNTYLSNVLRFKQALDYTPPTVDGATGEPAIDPATNKPYVGVTTYGDEISYFLETSMLDANNNNVQDEARLVRTAWYVDPADNIKKLVKSVVCDYVRPGGFKIVDNGNDSITITLQLRISDGKTKNGTVDGTAATTVLMRNRKI
jgi:prepilin-type N-terminal cleavage/methylation domain-containing protein